MLQIVQEASEENVVVTTCEDASIAGEIKRTTRSWGNKHVNRLNASCFLLGFKNLMSVSSVL